MGLPLFITPVEPEVAPKAADKSATAAARSTIRRQRTVRGPNSRSNAAEIRRRRILSMVADTTPDDYEAWELRQASPSNDGEEQDPAVAPGRLERRGEELHHSIMRRFGRDRNRDREPEPVSLERENPPSAQDGSAASMMPPVPETRDFYAVGPRRHELNRLRHRQNFRRSVQNAAPTPPYPTPPPYTDTDLAFLARIGLDLPRPASLTPALSPSHQVAMDDAEAPLRRPHGESLLVRATRPSRGTIDRPSRQTLSERVHSINRGPMYNVERARRMARQEMDGLGDRDRSLSPEGGSAWDTLLASITPDPQPPSAGSSFASASAAAAATSSASGSASANTSMTSVGLISTGMGLMDPNCDDSDSSNTEDEDDLYELQDFSRARGDRSLRSYAEVVTTHPYDRHIRPNVSADTEDLGGMHRIISRLAERDEIPDEWWASAGLSRNLRPERTT
ncbi:uncharacterized protein BP5553_05499 [Venustampulla echinocandica]|uniref:Uncharacterized protein n=1 Tax=Venustampulla echinocandica TaxID=2656787 RepID=A0A370TRA6_9HELO|nr:uncharacterized protein BP5553_05499 [Venustampulla echinocandica]RDL38066.1 hypothetical protein BP5553_05499 [Venustampulla echinocandica]